MVYDGSASTGQSIAELASYQGVPACMVLSLDWKIKDKGYDRYLYPPFFIYIKLFIRSEMFLCAHLYTRVIN
jgi:hypothetical protein